MLELFKVCVIDPVWALLNIPFTVDGHEFNTWQVFGFVALIAVTLNMIFKKQRSEGD